MSGAFALECDDPQRAASQLHGAQSKWAVQLRQTGEIYGVDTNTNVAP